MPPENVGLATISTSRTVFNLLLEIEYWPSITIDTIRMDKPSKIYFVNQSRKVQSICFPKSVAFEMEGAPEPRSVVLSIDGILASWDLPRIELLSPSRHDEVLPKIRTGL